MKPLLLSIDPSINNLGWALFSLEAMDLLASGVIRAPKLHVHLSLPKRIDYMCDQLGLLIHERLSRIWVDDAPTIYDAIVEQPQLWGAYKSVASQHSGSLLGLYLTVGALYEWLRIKASVINVDLVPVSEWKGQLPKEVTASRMSARWGRNFKAGDEADAVGLGTYWLELTPEQRIAKGLTSWS